MLVLLWTPGRVNDGSQRTTATGSVGSVSAHRPSLHSRVSTTSVKVTRPVELPRSAIAFDPNADVAQATQSPALQVTGGMGPASRVIPIELRRSSSEPVSWKATPPPRVRDQNDGS